MNQEQVHNVNTIMWTWMFTCLVAGYLLTMMGFSRSASMLLALVIAAIVSMIVTVVVSRKANRAAHSTSDDWIKDIVDRSLARLNADSDYCIAYEQLKDTNVAESKAKAAWLACDQDSERDALELAYFRAIRQRETAQVAWEVEMKRVFGSKE